jgi:hypothetical protein
MQTTGILPAGNRPVETHLADTRLVAQSLVARLEVVDQQHED